MTRRAVLAAVPVAATASRVFAQAPILAPAPGAAPLAGLRFRTVAVDTDRIAALGNPAGAAAVARTLSAELRQVFADRLSPNDARGATLLARISSLYLVPYAGGRDYGGMNSSGSGNDSLDGVGLVVAGGRTVSETPILAVLDPGYSGAWYLPDIDALRVVSICHQFAWWLRREMGV